MQWKDLRAWSGGSDLKKNGRCQLSGYVAAFLTQCMLAIGIALLSIALGCDDGSMEQLFCTRWVDSELGVAVFLQIFKSNT